MLLDTLKSKYNINACRVYATGFSSGGYMTYEVGCYLNSLFAAIAPVSGVMLTQHYNSRNLTHPTPLFHTHGDADPTVSYTGGNGHEGADNLVANFASYNSCTGPTTTTLTNSCTTDGCTVQSNIYSTGTNGSGVQKYKIIGGKHAWPTATCGSTSGTNGDYGGAALAIWRFFRPYCLGDLTGGSCKTPSITTQPTNQTVCSGSNTNFVVAASGSGTTYQWQVDQGSGFSDISNAAPYSGATTSTLTITGATAGLNGYKYKCLVGAGSCVTAVSTNTVTLTVNSCPTTPTATISGGTTVCQNASAPYITFTGANGTAPYVQVVVLLQVVIVDTIVGTYPSGVKDTAYFYLSTTYPAKLNSTLSPSSICSANTFIYNATSPTSGVSFTYNTIADAISKYRNLLSAKEKLLNLNESNGNSATIK